MHPGKTYGRPGDQIIFIVLMESVFAPAQGIVWHNVAGQPLHKRAVGSGVYTQVTPVLAVLRGVCKTIPVKI